LEGFPSSAKGKHCIQPGNPVAWSWPERDLPEHRDQRETANSVREKGDPSEKERERKSERERERLGSDS